MAEPGKPLSSAKHAAKARTRKQPADQGEVGLAGGLGVDEAERRFAVWLWRIVPAGSIGGAIAAGFVFDVGVSLLVLAGGVLIAVIAVLWASIRTLSGDAPITLEEAIALGAPTAAAEQKRAVLQALKDLEYERSLGKIDEADYLELVQRYRTEAKRLL